MMNETYIHIAIRRSLKKNGWKLIAGEYPGGSDDELYVLSIMDPEVARDNSPDPRRHSEGEIIPDLFAYKDGEIIVVEAKPKFNLGDEEKLGMLFSSKLQLMKSSLEAFCAERGVLTGEDCRNARYSPCLAFENEKLLPTHPKEGFAHLYVKDLDTVSMYRFIEGEAICEY